MKKILIVDDSAFMRNILKDLLTNSNEKTGLTDSVEFIEADGKANALIQVNLHKPDVILLDVVMKESEHEGVEFLRELKDKFNLKKVIMISSIGQQVTLDECNSLGIKSFLQKPFDPKEVIEAVNNAIEESK